MAQIQGKTKRRAQTGQTKVRVKLPQIETYQKELEFQAEASGRVVVRLERLMGTDRVRLTDTKYMSTLLERLEEEERKSWAKRRIGRIKAERNRFRQLAIDGLMDPGPEMQDLLQHPVFRVNRILNRLTTMDNMMTPTPDTKLPPIVEIDPFEDYDDGRSFRDYPGHISLQRQSTGILIDPGLPDDEEEEEESYSIKYDESDTKMVDSSSIRGSTTQSQRSIISVTTGSPTYKPKPRRMMRVNLRPSEVPVQELEELQEEYGVRPETDLLGNESYKSPLVRTVFEEDGQNLYRVADDVLQVYRAEQKAADHFLLRRPRNY